MASFALINDARRSEGQPSLPVRSWLLPSLAPRTAALIAKSSGSSLRSGFFATALSFWNCCCQAKRGGNLRLLPPSSQRLGSLFSGFGRACPNRKLSNIDTAIALGINAALLLLLLLGWLPGTLYGS